jgi:tetratricopeptide (TPR) repeat protein
MGKDDTSLGTIDEAARRRFEQGWRREQPEPIDACLPPPEHPAFLATLAELVQIELELAWKRWSRRTPTEPEKTPPGVAEYVKRFPQLQAPTILRRLCQQEFDVRSRAGCRPEPAEYPDGFAGFFTAEWSPPTVPDTPRPFPAGTPVIPGYEILEPVGRGGMGIVYKARQTSLGRVVALKMMLAGTAASTAERARFRTEAEALAQLQHPHIVQVFEVGEHDGQPFFSMEFVEGVTLAQRVAGVPQAMRDSAELVEKLARAVHAAHCRGILHRDLKPANILLTQEIAVRGSPDSIVPLSFPKITDFGLAKLVAGSGPHGAQAQTKTGDMLGTPSYMAPEQVQVRSGAIGPATDVYALGAILYELLTGRPPFRAESPWETIQLVLTQEPVPPGRFRPRLDRDLEAICLKCLEKAPASRYESAEALAEDLRRHLHDEPITARAVGPLRRAGRWTRRHPLATLAAAAGAALVISVATGVFLWQRAKFESQQQAFQYLTEHEAAARSSENLALAELRADRLDSARQILTQAVERLDHPELAAVRARVLARLERVSQLVEFYRQADRAERNLFSEREEAAIAAAEAALLQVNVVAGNPAWPVGLPAEDLSPAQQVRLRADVNQTLVLLAAMRLRQGLLTLNAAAKETAYRRALQDLELVERTPSLHSVRLLELLCRYGLGERHLEKLPSVEPQQGADAYLLGVAYLRIAGLQDLIRVAMPPELRDLTGLDFANPQAASERMLRAAAAMRPFHYWTHVWLGWCLSSGNNYGAAETAFNTCVALRPTEALGQSNRALVLLGQAKDLEPAQRQWHELQQALHDTQFMFALLPGAALAPPTPLAHVSLWAQERADALSARQAALRRRAQADLDAALALSPRDPLVFWIRLNCLATSGRPVAALESCIRYLELEMPLEAWQGRRPFAEKRAGLINIRNFARQQTLHQHDQPSVWGTLALACLALGDDEDALRAVDRALEVWPTQEQALIVRARIALQAGRFEEALADFDAVLRVSPDSFSGALGRAEARERLGKLNEALPAFERALRSAAMDWQQVAALHGQVRVLRQLGRTEEARRTAERANQLDPALTAAEIKKHAPRSESK